jgi:two-component system, NtrC family, sensor kinase
VNIRSKVIALIVGILLILGFAEVLIEQHVLMPSFAELERNDARTAMRRIDYALDQTISQVAVSAGDWGNWADTYRFVQDHNPEYIKANLDDIALRQLNVNTVIIVDEAGNFVETRDLNLTTGKSLGLDLASLAALPADFPWRAHLRDGKPAKGLLKTNRGVIMLAAAPVLDGAGHGPVRGMVILGRLLSPANVSAIASQAQANLTMLGAVAGQARDRLVESDDVTRVYRAFDDVYGRRLMTLRVDVPRLITDRGRTAVTYASSCLLAAAVLALIVLVLLLNRAIVSPLALVTRHAIQLGADRDLTARLDLKRNDEIGVLAREFDRMVGRVAESRTQLVDQSYQAGFAELAKGVLHNLGNAMTPLGVRLAGLTDRLREAPVEDAEQAVAELQAGTANAERAADLQEFMMLACKEFAGTVRVARESVAVIVRQASLIQTTVTEQMRTARNEQVIEPVRLSELMAQSLEIVPDSCRQRLAVRPDDSVRKVGVVRVARTVLRLVLQNLIINAAEAVRDAGKTHGELHVSAEIVRAADREQLHLHCKDDGVGIAPQNLTRVFEKGFSTKSPETNHGIGLHWCANAVNALGGRIWAASDGPGCGASLHLLVPLMARETNSLAGAA